LGDLTGTRPFTIGATAASQVYKYSGDMAGVIVSEGIKTTAQREQVEAYLASLAGITL